MNGNPASVSLKATMLTGMVLVEKEWQDLNFRHPVLTAPIDIPTR